MKCTPAPSGRSSQVSAAGAPVRPPVPAAEPLIDSLMVRKAIARRARQYGHFMAGIDVWVICPRCRGQVHGDWGTATRQVRTLNQELDRAMVEHLSGECEAAA